MNDQNPWARPTTTETTNARVDALRAADADAPSLMELGDYLGDDERFVVLATDDNEIRVAIVRDAVEGAVEEAWGIAPTWSDAARLAILARNPDYIVDDGFKHLAD